MKGEEGNGCAHCFFARELGFFGVEGRLVSCETALLCLDGFQFGDRVSLGLPELCVNQYLLDQSLCNLATCMR